MIAGTLLELIKEYFQGGAANGKTSGQIEADLEMLKKYVRGDSGN